jgi:hypothetical protein
MNTAQRGRTGIGVVLLVSLLASAFLQQYAYSYRFDAVNRNRPKDIPAPSRVANLDSFSLALLLGGLRGPLVMFLWTNSENQKSDKDLESFDTQVELIRLLQPEFDSVHLFQIWNKAYNISVQLASLSNKYAAIVDALDYAWKTDKANPNDINILTAIGGLFADKLGNSAEKEYYRRRVRTETLPIYRMTFPADRLAAFKKAVADAGVEEAGVRLTTANGTTTALMDKVGGDRVLTVFKDAAAKFEALPRQALRPETRSGRRTELDTLVDANGMFLPEYLKPVRKVPAGVDENDGSELQYLAQFQPYPYGVSSIALGYNYFKRAQVLQTLGRQKHLQLSDMVIDNQPGLTLKAWGDEELDRGRRLEQRGLPRQTATENLARELRTAAVTPDAGVADRPAIDEAIFSYERAAQVATAALPELEKHVDRFPSKLQNYNSQRDTLNAVLHLMHGDANYLRAIANTTPAKRAELLAAAKAEYQEASRYYHILILKYCVEEADATAMKYTLLSASEKKLPELEQLWTGLQKHLMAKYKTPANTPHQYDLQEYGEYIERINKRVGMIK